MASSKIIFKWILTYLFIKEIIADLLKRPEAFTRSTRRCSQLGICNFNGSKGLLHINDSLKKVSSQSSLDQLLLRRHSETHLQGAYINIGLQ